MSLVLDHHPHGVFIKLTIIITMTMLQRLTQTPSPGTFAPHLTARLSMPSRILAVFLFLMADRAAMVSEISGMMINVSKIAMSKEQLIIIPDF